MTIRVDGVPELCFDNEIYLLPVLNADNEVSKSKNTAQKQLGKSCHHDALLRKHAFATLMDVRKPHGRY